MALPLAEELRGIRKSINISHISPTLIEDDDDQSPWANLQPELLLDIIKRVESTSTTWPARRDLAACAAVCQSWREAVWVVVKTPHQSGLLTFPVSLKQAGPREDPIQCFIRRDMSTSTYLLYLGLSPALSGEETKLLLAAKKVRKATCLNYIISLAPDDFSRASSNCIGKLRSNFLGTKFTIYDSQPAWDGYRRIRSRQFSPSLFTESYPVDSVQYELNVLHARSPRKMSCTMHTIPESVVSWKSPLVGFSTKSSTGTPESVNGAKEPLILTSKAPRWHQQLQCWCLNFKGRVTVASVKNFQLVAAVEVGQNVSGGDEERVILQFGKIGKDVFTMDYSYPLSAFQAFAICLSSFNTKPACE